MNLRLKTLLVSSVATIGLIAGLSIGLSSLILYQIAQVETSTMQRRVDQVIQSLLEDAGALPKPGQLGNSADRRQALTQGLAQADVAIVRNSAGQAVSLNPSDPLAQQLKLPTPALRDSFANIPDQWGGSIPTEKPLSIPEGIQIGLLQTSEGVFLLIEQPLARQPGAAPSGAAPLRLLTGQRLSSARLRALGQRSLLMVNLLPMNAPNVPAQLRDRASGKTRMIQDLAHTNGFASNNSPPVPPLGGVPPNQPPPGAMPPDRQPPHPPTGAANGSPPMPGGKSLPSGASRMIAGYVRLSDVYGQPVAILQAISPKPFAQTGEDGVRVLLILLWTSGLAYGIALNVLLDRSVLARVASLGRQLRQVSGDASKSPQVTLPGHDELSLLAADINAMLKRQGHYQKKLHQANAEIEQANRELERLASTDGLTQVMNRRFFQMHLEELWHLASQASQPLALLLCDVDFFKLYNDTYGHLAGDLCLQKVAKAMATVSAEYPPAIVARYGGEEFAALLPNTQTATAQQVAEQFRLAIWQLNLPHSSSKAADRVTLSIGVCSLIPGSDQSPRDLIAQADTHLYQAKAQGRNCVVAEIPNHQNKSTLKQSRNHELSR